MFYKVMRENRLCHNSLTLVVGIEATSALMEFNNRRAVYKAMEKALTHV